MPGSHDAKCASCEPSTEIVPDPSTLVDLLRWRALHQPDSPAFKFLGDDDAAEVSLTYREVDRWARTVALSLREVEAEGQPVLICHPPGMEYITAFFGCLYAGAIAVPAYHPHPSRAARTVPRLRAIARAAQATLALAPPSALPAAESLCAGDPSLSSLRWHIVEDHTNHPADGWEPPPARDEDPAFLMYTSGSTGAPRGVTVTHGNVLHNLSAFSGFEHRPCSVFVSWLPLFHDLGLMFGVMHPLYRGVPAVLMSPLSFAQHPFRWLETISRWGASTSCGPNFAYDVCVRKTTPEQRATLDLRRWTMALNGAEPVRAETLDRFTAAFAPCGFRREAFYPSYGLAEGTATVTGGGQVAPPLVRAFQRRSLEDGRVINAPGDENARTLVGCGSILPGQKIVVVAPESLTACQADEVGEIWVAGPSVAAGYWNRPEETEHVFGAHLADTGDGPFLRTGDLGFLRDGELFMTGRLKDVMIIHGSNHYPEDIELTVEQHCPLVRPGCGAAFSVEVDGEERAVIVYEVRPAEELDADRVIGDIRQAVAENHQIDVFAVAVIESGSIPKTSSGKLQRQRCRAQFLDGTLAVEAEWRATLSPGDDLSTAVQEDGDSVSPTDEPGRTWLEEAIEKRLISHLARHLAVAARDLDVHLPFARLGLASLEAVSLIGELEKWLGRSLPPTLLWDHPSIRSLARHLAAPQDGGLPAGREATGTVPRNEPLSHRPEPIAIVGMSCRFPEATSPAALWELLANGVDAIREVPPDRWDIEALYDPDPAAVGKTITRWGGFLDGLDRFDASFFRISPREAPHLDPRQRLLLELAWEALDDAGFPQDALAGTPTGVFIAALSNDYEELLFKDSTRVDAYSGPGTTNSILANRLSYFLDLRGPSMVLDTACSGSLVAIHLACQSIRTGEVALALAGGVSVNLSPNGDIFFSRAGVLSPDGRCKTFSPDANGMVRSEGAGLVVLKPLSRALADGDPIVALIRGSAVNSDGRSNGLMAPNRLSQESVLRAAYQQAGVSPGQVQYVEAHGTATTLGDAIELQALGTVLSAGRPPGWPCAVGSVKTNLGHLEPAAGVAGVMKVALSLQHRLIPPSLHYKEHEAPDPVEGLPLVVQRSLGPWQARSQPLLAGVSSFGFGGTNAHVVLEEAPPRAASHEEPSTVPYVLPLSARDAGALHDLARSYRRLLLDDAAPPVTDVTYTAGVRRSHHDHRLACVARSRQELAAQLEAFNESEPVADLYIGDGPVRGERKLALIFSGQGSHWAGMGRGLLYSEPTFRASIEACDPIVREHAGWSLLDALSSDEANSRLHETDVAQPAIFAVQVALAALWRSWGITPAAVAGQSLGEVAAAHVSGAISLEDAVRIVVERGRLMKTRAGQGKTAAVGLSIDRARLALTGWEDLVSVAGSNSPESSVLAGDPEALQRILRSLQQQGVFCRLVRGVDIAFHSPQMEPLMSELANRLAGVAPRATSIPLFSTVTGALIRGEQLDAAYWARNLREPFLFSTVMEQLIRQDYDTFLEVSPHPVLMAPMLQGLHELGCHAMVLPSLQRGQEERAALLGSLASLYTVGISVDWKAFYPQGGRHVSLPSYPWQRERYWFDDLPGGNARLHAGTGGHPLLGASIHSAVPPYQSVWEIDLHASSLHYLRDHRVEGAAVFPGSAFLEMALAAAAEVLGSATLTLQDVAFQRALVLPEDAARTVQLVMAPDAADEASFQILSLPHGAGRGDPWTQHATGKIARQSEAEPGASQRQVSLPEIQTRCAERLGATEHYQTMGRLGLHYGPSFQAIEEIWRRDGEVLARVRLPNAVAAGGKAYLLHPVLLDAAFQSAAALNGHDSRFAEEMLLPLGVRALSVYHRSDAPLWCHTIVRESGDAGSEDVEVDMTLLSDDGRVVAEVAGLRLGRLTVDRHLRAEQPADWLYEMQWLPQPRVGAAGGWPIKQPGSWVIFGSRHALGGALASLLEERGEHCVLVAPGEAFQDVLDDALRNEQWPCRGVVCASEPAATTPAPKEADSGSSELLAITQTMAHAGRSHLPRLWIVTRGAVPVGSTDKPLSLGQATLWGLGAVIANEHPELWGGLIDLDPEGALHEQATALLDQIWDPDREDRLAFHAGGRYVPRLARCRPAAQRPAFRFRVDAAYLITGGLGGLGLAVARWMVQRGARRLVLLSRTELPPRSAWAQVEDGRLSRLVSAIKELEEMGASIHLASVDVAEERELSCFLRQFREEGWPAIRGVVHAAGLLEDQLLLRMDAASLHAVLRPKTHGAWNLDRLLHDAPLDFFVLFSSIASVLGPVGQANYAAGNAFMDALAHDRRRQGLPALSINWGPWSEVGMAAEDLETQWRHAQQGIRALTPQQGTQILEQLLHWEEPQVAVMSLDWQLLRDSHPFGGIPPLFSLIATEHASEPAPQVPTGSNELLQRLLLAGPAEREALLAAHVHDDVARVLCIPEGHLDPRQPLSALGMDSITAMELKNWIERSVGVPVSIVDLLQDASVERLTAQLLARVNPDDAQLAEALTEVEQLSMAEVQALLTETSAASDEQTSG